MAKKPELISGMENLQYTSDWFSHNIPHWRKWLSPFYGKDHIVAVEVGSWEGRSAKYICDNILTGQDCRLHCIDTFQGSAENANDPATPNIEQRFRHNLAAELKSGQVEVHVGMSHVHLARLATQGLQADFIYIDGSHEAPDVLVDACLAWNMLKPGGVMIFDDYRWNKFPERERCPKLAIDSFMQCFVRRYKLLGIEYQAAILKL